MKITGINARNAETFPEELENLTLVDLKKVIFPKEEAIPKKGI